MASLRIALLGGDARQQRVAERLRELGHDARVFGLEKLATLSTELAPTARDAVAGAQWVICPAPGLDGDRLYAPFAAAPVVVDEELLSGADLPNGGLILGRASPALREMSERLGFRIVETKNERHMAIANATSVAEGLLRLLIERTDRTLREYAIAVVGYGATGAEATDVLLALGCTPTVIVRSKVAQARAEQRGASSAAYADRVGAMEAAEIIINTVPDVDAVPRQILDALGDRMVVDIASPPGGLRHDELAPDTNVVWARGLGGRAPRTSGDIQFRFVAEVIAEGDA